MTIQYEIIDAHIRRITLDRPEVLNAFNFQMMDAFAAAIEQVHVDPDARVLVVTGAGKRGFSSGGDLKFLSAYGSEMDGRRISETMQSALDRLEKLPIPTIAAINGHTRGGGAEIAIACDFRLMSVAATFGFTHLNVAVSTAWGGARRLLRTVGYAAAVDMLLHARVYNAPETLERRLVHEIHPEDDLAAKSLDLAARLADLPQPAARAIKEILLTGTIPLSDEASRLERERFPELWVHPDHQALTQAFLDRKK